MLKKLICLIFAVMLIAVTVNAKPGKPILKMLNTPITAFDFFLFELEESCKCDKWFGNPNWKSDPCMTVLKYNITDDLILLNFYIYDPSRSTTYMKGFINSNNRQKEQILRAAIERLAIVVGVAKRPNKGKRYGLIQVTSIRRGWYDKNFNEAELKDEIAKRTVLTLQTKYQGKLYHIERGINGEIIYEVSPAKEAMEPRESRE